MDLLSFRKNVFGLICLVITAVIFLAGLWPFNFWPENKVRWLQDQNGVEFYGQSLIYSTTPSFQSSSLPMESFSLEIWLQPERESYDYAARILTFYDQQKTENMTLTQWKSTFIAQGRIQNRSPERYPKVGVTDALLKGVKRLFTITSGLEGTKIYIDGKLTGNYPKFNLLSEIEGNVSQLILGNSSTGEQYWTGNLLGLAIYNRSLSEEQVLKSFENWEKNRKSLFQKEKGLVSSYLFNERSGTLAHDHAGNRHLILPSRFEVLQKTVLVPPWEDFRFTRSYLMDILTNILGFIPFGFFFSTYLWMRRLRSHFQLLLRSAMIAGCISLLIELIQGYLPTRNSQLMDVMMNMLGTAIGVSLFFKTHMSWSVGLISKAARDQEDEDLGVQKR
jgi:hypothetical protein